MKDEIALKILFKTRKDYNRMAEAFSSKRTILTADIVFFKNYAKKGDRILDYGCGNGRLSELFPPEDFDYFGVDFSRKMVALAKQKYPGSHFKTTPLLGTNLKDSYFDIVYALSVFHHIPSKKYRQKYLFEIKRILKPGGKLILTVWKLSKHNFKDQGKRKNKCQLDPGDVFIAFKESAGNVLANRYFHQFSLNDLKKEIARAGFNIIKAGIKKRGKKIVNENFYIIAIN